MSRKAQSIAKDCLRRGGGNAASSAARSSGVSAIAPAAAFWRTCAGSAAFGIATTPGARSVQASATCAGRGPVPVRHLAQRRVPQQPPALPDRRVGHHRHRPLAAPRQQVELDAARLEVVQHLVGEAARRQRLHLVHVEIRHAPAPDLARLAQPLERLRRLLDRRAARPVQQIQVDALDPEPPQAARARRRHAGAASRCADRPC